MNYAEPEIPLDEAKRLAALYATNLFGTGPEEAFDRITRLATKLLGVPTALISLVGSDVQWFKSRCGFAAQYTSRDVSICGHAILSDAPLVIPDTARDPRFADNPIVVGAPYIRFHAGVQLYSVERARLGTLCIIDTEPREIGAPELAEMHELARMVEELIYHRQLAFAAEQLHAQLNVQLGTQADDRPRQGAPSAQLASAADQVAFLLTHDTLTGLANRQALLRMIRDSVDDWRSRGVPAVVACLNIDRFKRINEAMGHAAGDEVLIAVTRNLKAHLAPGEMLARTGNDEFIPIAEETGLIVPIGEWIVGTAIRQMAAWREEGLPEVPVAVNLSARQFLQGDVVATIEHLLQGAGLGADALELELTESVSMADPERSLAIMHRLKKLGVTLSIDDFGTGYSSFSYLKRLPIDKLKIDRSFIHDMVHNADSRAIVGAIVAMAHRLNLRVVAEGVELEAQAGALRDSGCDQAHGFLYARPLDALDAGLYLAVRPETGQRARRHAR